MKHNDFEFIIISPVNYEKLACEIYYKSEIIAEISQEAGELRLEIYPSQIHPWWIIPFEQFQDALSRAKHHLFR